MHQRFSNSSAKPASGPECSVPATGWAGTKCTVFGRCGPMSRTTEPFTEPTSETVAPGLRCGPISLATAPQTPTGTQTMTRSAPSTASALVSVTVSARPSSTTRLRVFGECADGHDLAHGALGARGARDRRADQPHADDGERVEQRLGHQRAAPLASMNDVSASSTARFSSSLPMVRRSASGRPYSSTRRKMMRR